MRRTAMLLAALLATSASAQLKETFWSVKGKRATKIRGNRDTSTNVRYKFGDNLKGGLG